jgi:hypothetical protein
VGLRRKTFWIAVVVLIVIIGSISGGIGGYLSHKRSTPIQSNTPNDEPNIFPNISAKLSLESAFLNTSLAVSTRGGFNSTESYLFYQSNSLEFFFVLIQPEMSSIPQSLGSSYPARKYTPLSALGAIDQYGIHQDARLYYVNPDGYLFEAIYSPGNSVVPSDHTKYPN